MDEAATPTDYRDVTGCHLALPSVLQGSRTPHDALKFKCPQQGPDPAAILAVAMAQQGSRAWP